MVRGDKKSDLQTIPANSELVIQPPPGEEWTIHNIYSSKAAEIKSVKNSLEIILDASTEAESWLSFVFNLTNEQYLKFKNTSSEDSVMGFDGVQTK